jgi:uncharacterized membrane protein
MENKKVGYLLIGVAVVMGVLVWQFYAALISMAGTTCAFEHEGETCPLHASVNQQIIISVVLLGLVLIVGVVLILSKPEREVIVQRVKERVKKKEYDLSGLTADERRAFSVVREEKSVFQAALIEELEFGKAKMTRVIDRLEGRGLVERKRRGMTNVVVLKE